jgi:Fe2+ transport system protein B
MKFCKQTETDLIQLFKSKRIYLEGNVIKVVETDNKEFDEYLKASDARDRESRKRRLDITKQIQSQNKELELAAQKNNELLEDLQVALKEAKCAKQEAEKLRDQAVEDLDTLQKRTQFELINLIVRIALGIIVGVGIVTTFLYIFLVATGNRSEIVESAWSNMFGILLTNSFSIIGTIMGVKYATDNIKK